MGTEKDEQFRRTAEAEDGAAVSAGVWLGDPTAAPDPPSAQVKAAEAIAHSLAVLLETARVGQALTAEDLNGIMAELVQIERRLNWLIEAKTGRTAGTAK